MPVPHRRALLLAALSLSVAFVAVIGAMYRAEPSVGLRTGGPSEAQELYLRPGTTPILEDPTSTTVPGTAPTTTAAVAPRTTPTTEARTAAGEPVGCVPGTYVEQGHRCQWKPVTITGRVIDTTGKPLPGICVRTFMIPQDIVARTDAEGRYRMQAPQGGVPLSAEACEDTRPEFGWTRGGVQSPLIEPGGSGTADDIVLTERGGVYGRVVDPAGNPLAGICIGGGAASDADGRFATEPFAPGHYDVGASGGGTASCPTVALSLDQVPADVTSGRWTGPVNLVAHPQVG